MLNFFIDGELATVDKVEDARNNFAKVFVNGYSGCHSIPAHLAKFDIIAAFYTSGHTYHITNKEAV